MNKNLPSFQEIYELGVEMGIKADPRPKSIWKKTLKDAKSAWKKCKTDLEKTCFDQDCLWNPFADSRILAGDPEQKIRKIAFGIDIETAELMLIDQLNRNGEGIDLVMAHHPEDRALLGLADVMKLQIDVYHKEGVPVNIAEKLMKPRIGEINDALHSINYHRATRAAELLKLNFMCLHTPCDNNGYQFLNKYFAHKDNLYLKDIITELQKIPEFAEASRRGNPPMIAVGSPENRAGKIVITEFTGGTSGSDQMYEKLAQAGVGTVLTMHISKTHKEQAEKAGIQVINCGHMASDSLGINLILDEIAKQGVEIIPLSGFIRYSRLNKTFTN